MIGNPLYQTCFTRKLIGYTMQVYENSIKKNTLFQEKYSSEYNLHENVLFYMYFTAQKERTKKAMPILMPWHICVVYILSKILNS